MSLEFKNVSLNRNGDTHIYSTDLTLVNQEFNVLLGTTLAGKTSLMRLSAGLDRPSSGEIWFEGRNITTLPVQKRSVAMVYQQFINYPNYTVYDNIASPLRLQGLNKKSMDDSIQQVAELLQLTPMLQRKPSELSGGQQQRTALARALVKKAKLVLLDEPLANLDYKLREELRDELPKLFRDTGATVVYATTEPGEAMLLGGYTATVFEGRVIQYGPTGDVYRQPVNRCSASVFSDPPMNTTTVLKRAGQFSISDGVSWKVSEDASHLSDGEYTMGFRPNHLTLQPTHNDVISVPADVLLTEITGSESTVHAGVNDHTWISLSRGVHSLDKGQRVELYLDTRQIFLFDQQDRLVWS